MVDHSILFHPNRFSSGMYTEAQAIIEAIPNSTLKVRLLFHLAHKLNDEDRLLELHGSLRDVYEDQLSLASMHYLRAHYQDAIDIYKRLLLDKKLVNYFIRRRKCELMKMYHGTRQGFSSVERIPRLVLL